MKSLSEAIKAQNTTMDAYCVQNGVRPLLSYGAKGTRVGRKTFLFASALRQWEHLHDRLDLAEAYKKAKNTFNGKLEQLFVVLKEGRSEHLTGVNQIPVGQKRNAEEPLAGPSAKRI